MLRKLLPRQDNFFILFQQIAGILVSSATEFRDMLHDLPQQQKYVDTIANLEEQADKIAHNTFSRLHKTFITPFDRNDIHRLTSGLDDILDQINRCAQRFPFYDLKTVPHEITRLAELNVDSSIFLREALSRLNSLKQDDEIFSYCENHFKQFFKLKEIYSRTKLVIDAIQDVGNIIKGIVLEYT
jgi:uncharacterized protein Yka (UPF0111/DUF47 family)